MHILATLEPLDPATGLRPMLRASSVQDRAVNGLGGERWWPAITRKPTLNLKLFDGDFTSSIEAGSASLEINVAHLARLDPQARRFIWAGAKVVLYCGDADDPWPWPVAMQARVSSFKAEGNGLSLGLSVDAEPFKAKVPAATYAGTSGLEGGTDLKGKVKPLCLGAPRNVEPVLINVVDNVYQFHAGGPLKAVETLYERGSAFPAATGDHATYSALLAASIPNGRYATCLASGLVRLGAPAYGVITGDIQGDFTGSAWARKPGAIIKRLFALAGASSSLYDGASLDAMDSIVEAYPADGNISLVLADQTDLLGIAQQIAQSCNYQAGVGLDGRLFVTTPVIGSPSLTLDAQGARMPKVLGAVEVEVSPPYKRIQMGGVRSWRVHSFEEVATTAALTDRGDYGSAVTYREGDMVTGADGSRWLFVGTTPAAGSAPSDSNANWSRMTGPPNQAAIDNLLALVTDAKATADAKRQIFYQGTAPAATESEENDLWINTAEGERLYVRVTGSGRIAIGGDLVTIGGDYLTLVWRAADDQRIAQAIEAAVGAAALADGKAVVFTMLGASDPVPSGTAVGDLLVRAYLSPPRVDHWDSSAWQIAATTGAPTGTYVGGTPAATVETGANAGNAAANGDGSIKTGKVDTPAIVPGAVEDSFTAVAPSDVTLAALTTTEFSTISVTGVVPGELLTLFGVMLLDGNNDQSAYIYVDLTRPDATTVNLRTDEYRNDLDGVGRIFAPWPILCRHIATQSGTYVFRVKFYNFRSSPAYARAGTDFEVRRRKV